MNARYALPVLLLICGLAQGADNYVGTAAIDAEIAQARQAALADAEAQAAEQEGMQIRSDTTQEGDQITLHTGPTPRLRVIEEWRDGDLYHVRAERDGANGGCGPQYRKRIAATAFPLLHPDQVYSNGIHGFEVGIPHELLHRLAASGNFLSRGVEAITLYDANALAPEGISQGSYGRSRLLEHADRVGADLILSGVVRDLGLEVSRFQLPYVGRIGSSDRRVEIDLFIHDGHTGALLLRHHYAEEASGEVMLDRQIPFASAAFYRTDLGHSFDAIFDRAVQEVQERLHCLPFTARVLRVSGDEVVIDAGADTRIQVGDELIAHATRRDQLFDSGARSRGPEREPQGSVQVVDVQADYSVAQLNGATALNRLQAGDLVSTR